MWGIQTCWMLTANLTACTSVLSMDPGTSWAQKALPGAPQLAPLSTVAISFDSLDPFTAFWDFLTSIYQYPSQMHNWKFTPEMKLRERMSLPPTLGIGKCLEILRDPQVARQAGFAQQPRLGVGVEDLWLWLSRLGYVKRIMFLVQYFGLPIHFGVNHFGPCGLMDHFASFHEIIWGGMMKLYYLQRRAGWLDQKSS